VVRNKEIYNYSKLEAVGLPDGYPFDCSLWLNFGQSHFFPPCPSLNKEHDEQITDRIIKRETIVFPIFIALRL
ncbi:MAG: hypothetical protein ACHQFW_11890, partial [Chitinophagales bacterium]